MFLSPGKENSAFSHSIPIIFLQLWYKCPALRGLTNRPTLRGEGVMKVKGDAIFFKVVLHGLSTALINVRLMDLTSVLYFIMNNENINTIIATYLQK